MNYDIAEALRKMEEELIQSMKRNLQRHLKEEDAEGFDWTQWQAENLILKPSESSLRMVLSAAITATASNGAQTASTSSYASECR